jgi:hypothetical protein
MLKIAAILIVVWLVGLLAFKTIGAIIHIALILGVIFLVLHFIRGKRSV